MNKMSNINLNTNQYDAVINEVEKLLEPNLFKAWLDKKESNSYLSEKEECLLSSYLNEYLLKKAHKYKVILSDDNYIVDNYIESNLPYWAEIFSECNGYLGFISYLTYQKLINLIIIDYDKKALESPDIYIKKVEPKYYKELVKTGVIKQIRGEYYE